MEKSSWIQAVQGHLKNQIDLLEDYTRLDMYLYLFGSATRSEHPSDLDVAILYHGNAMKQARQVCDATIQRLKIIIKIPIDCVLLSFVENEQVCFTEKEKAILIFPIY